MTTTYYRIADGQQATAEEALLNGALRDGFGARNSVTFREGSATSEGEFRDGGMAITHSQDLYERRVSNAWKGADGQAAARGSQRLQLSRYRHAPVSDAQEKYEARISGAWKGGVAA